MNPKPFTVRAVHCDYRATDEEVYQSLKRAVDPLDRCWEKLRKAKRIAIKFNQDWSPKTVVYHQGHRQQLVSDQVARAVLRLLRERTAADLFMTDVAVEHVPENGSRADNTQLLPILREFDVPYVDGNLDEVCWVDVPGGGLMFDRYPVPKATYQADAVISVQKMKNHRFMGITLCLKNLFGLVPLLPRGRPRMYYHHLVRMPYMLVDLGRIFNPTLSIIDGLVGQAGMEWGPGQYPRVCNTLVAGDQVVATDACTAYLMGHDPQFDWLTPPFLRDRNALLIASQNGFGDTNLENIDFSSEVEAPVGEFFSDRLDGEETVVSWRRTTAEQGLYYRDHFREIVSRYAGQYILLQMGQVQWSNPDGNLHVSRRVLSGEHPEQAMWLKYVDPDESEREHFEVYEQTITDMNKKGY